jgi:hypothetical protein
MATTFPFDIPECVRAKLPPASTDGKVYADVKFRGRWEGILVINSEYQCVGVYCGRQIIQWPLPFAPSEIEDVRRPCLWNRLLAALPEGCDIYGCSVLTIWIGCPLLLILGLAFSRWLLVLMIPLVVLAIALMYAVRGFPLTRLPTALAGLGFALAAVIGFIKSFV